MKATDVDRIEAHSIEAKLSSLRRARRWRHRRRSRARCPCSEGTGSPEWAVETFTDLEEDVRDSIARIRASPFLPNKDSVRGFVYDVATGELAEVS